MDALGEACVFALEHWQPGPDKLSFIRIGTGVELSILEIAAVVANITRDLEMVHWEISKSDGTSTI